MPTRPRSFRPGPPPQRSRADPDRGNARERGYTPAWDRASKDHLARFPLCGYCQAGAFGKAAIRAATATDHLYPQRRYPGVFWEEGWWVSTCVDCHNAKQAIERRGKPAIDALARRLGLPVLKSQPGQPAQG